MRVLTEACVTLNTQGGKIGSKSEPVKAFFEVASLVFIAEWGDRCVDESLVITHASIRTHARAHTCTPVHACTQMYTQLAF
jgi:putative Ca2+/H+ antiporter (TMEM165/GDT1 family)